MSVRGVNAHVACGMLIGMSMAHQLRPFNAKAILYGGTFGYVASTILAIELTRSEIQMEMHEFTQCIETTLKPLIPLLLQNLPLRE